jgi:hypothetical protein
MFKYFFKLSHAQFAADGVGIAPFLTAKKSAPAPGEDKMLQNYCRQVVTQAAAPDHKPTDLWLKLPH